MNNNCIVDMRVGVTLTERLNKGVKDMTSWGCVLVHYCDKYLRVDNL